MLKKIFVVLLLLVINVAVLFVTFVGPWPTYAASDLSNEGYYTDVVQAIDADASVNVSSEPAGALQAGWAKAEITPEIGTPLAGFGDRKGAPSTGVHDPLFAKALCVSDGADTAVIVGADILIMPENVADRARKLVEEQSDVLSADDILFTASHSHSGPGGWAPGYIGKQFSGGLDPAVIEFLAQRFAKAIVEAHAALEPAKVAHASTEAPDYVRNRTRDAAIDTRLNVMVIEQDDGDQCYVTRFSGHATVMGGGNMEFSGDYPGYVQRAIERETGGFAVYLGGAVGSTSISGPDGPGGFERAERIGEGLAKLALEAIADPEFKNVADVAAIGVGYDLPPLQMRLNKGWRVSPFLLPIAGIDSDGWIQCVRLGDVMIYGTPADFSGEISIAFRPWAEERGIDLWVTSFNGDYAGYVSPDRYYLTADQDEEGYEMYFMSWLGPNQEQFFTKLLHHLAGLTFPEAG